MILYSKGYRRIGDGIELIRDGAGFIQDGTESGEVPYFPNSYFVIHNWFIILLLLLLKSRSHIRIKKIYN